jgi:hypothetical protein
MADNDVAGGDGSDSDLYEIASEAAATAIEDLLSTCSNEGMYALAEMISDAIVGEAENMAQMSPPDMFALFGAIAGVHSEDTAMSCMTEGISIAFEDLMDGWDQIVAHELAEGNSL